MSEATEELDAPASVHAAMAGEDAEAWQRIEEGIADEELEESKVDGDGHEAVESNQSVDTDEVDTLLDGDAGDDERGGGVEVTYDHELGAIVEEVEGYLPEESMIADDVLEIVHGHDDRVRVANTRSYPWRTICHLRITSATGSVHGCSGAMIGPRTVLTNGHCVYMHGRGGWVKKIEVTPGRNGSIKPFGTATSSHFISTKGWVKDRSSNYDYAVIILPKSQKLGNDTGWMGLANLSFFSLMGLRVNNSGYPGDKPYGTQWWNANNVLAVTARRLYYRLDTYGGQSGSPVWRYKNKKRHIVAVHNTGGNPFNGSVRITKSVFDNLVKWKNTYT
ncbi:MAG: serine protease [Actinomycetota bacterium]